MLMLPKIAEIVVEALRTGLQYAAGDWIGTDLVDSDLWFGDTVTEAERIELLEALLSDPGLAEEDLELHLGEPPLLTDRRVHTIISSVIRAHRPDAYIIGEEATTSEWEEADNAPTGSEIITIDAIDGSVPYQCLGFGYSSNILVHQRWRRDDTLMLSAVANSSGILVLYHEGEVIVGDVNAPTQFTVASSPLVDPKIGSVAILGALPRHRVRIADVLGDAEATVFTVAGAPAAAGLIAGSLESLVAHSPQTLHDAAFLPMLAALRIPILSETGEWLESSEIDRLFKRQWDGAAEHPRSQHPCPAFVASRNPLRAMRLAKKLGWQK